MVNHFETSFFAHLSVRLGSYIHVIHCKMATQVIFISVTSLVCTIASTKQGIKYSRRVSFIHVIDVQNNEIGIVLLCCCVYNPLVKTASRT